MVEDAEARVMVDEANQKRWVRFLRVWPRTHHFGRKPALHHRHQPTNQPMARATTAHSGKAPSARWKSWMHRLTH